MSMQKSIEYSPWVWLIAESIAKQINRVDLACLAQDRDVFTPMIAACSRTFGQLYCSSKPISAIVVFVKVLSIAMSHSSLL